MDTKKSTLEQAEWHAIDDILPQQGSTVLTRLYPPGCMGNFQEEIARFDGNFIINGLPNRDVTFWSYIKS